MNNISLGPGEPLGLVADIGGTNARFALTSPAERGFTDEYTMRCEDFPGVDHAISSYLRKLGITAPRAICLAIAGRVDNQEAKLTNSHWFVSTRELAAMYPDSRIELINDFTAIAFSIPCLGEADLLPIGSLAPDIADRREYKVAVLGPGTGLGVAGLMKIGEQLIPITSEAGHMGFSPETEQQDRLLSTLRVRWPRVSIERLVSGGGIENILWALRKIENMPENFLSAEAIFQHALSDDQSIEYRAVQMFLEILGQAAGDIALAYNAEDGVYIAGGMVKRYADLLRKSRFREAFISKGRYCDHLQTIPTSLITHAQPGLLGASRYCQDNLAPE